VPVQAPGMQRYRPQNVAWVEPDSAVSRESTCDIRRISTVKGKARHGTFCGHATGKSSAVSFLSEYLKTHHPETFQRIITIETADLSALTEPEVEAIAKKHIRGASVVPA
jgi:hypothetical protein